ncbi:Protein of unknown function DUF1814 [Moorella glycerini]|uniref:Nucleotidyl transferase AbiEii toxin, Type IV TA system n=1 Tax=Neomoorella stamsii TaxID=1266720 RepID=A0A9X7J1F1_9FIRM|nr:MULTISPECIES: nucleotidyl transferase AbiEii/AbiGii toxin family protein [Moorella]PRR71501.1 hypothetical protein MOST_25570 [Moorella stamsii]CEP68712.1 Protein of unknown function DUF1814 [Moorella glycerini]
MPIEPWRGLFRTALAILAGQNITTDTWTFGGGTALALFLRHRESRDVDIFLSDAQLLSLLTPRLNEDVAEGVSDYTEGSSFLKLKYPEGEIDFIIAPFLTRNPWIIMEVEGVRVRVETPEEIIIKKLFYRAETLRARDIVDTAAVFAARKEYLLAAAAVLASRLEALQRRWERLQPAFLPEARFLRAKEGLVEKTPALFMAFLSELQSRIGELQSGRKA